MRYVSRFSLDLGEQAQIYFNLLSEEDFDFKTKDIKVDVTLQDLTVNVEILCSSLIDLKIGTSSVIKSLEIIHKTLEV